MSEELEKESGGSGLRYTFDIKGAGACVKSALTQRLERNGAESVKVPGCWHTIMVRRDGLEVSEMPNPPPRFVRVPGNFPTLRASNVFVAFDGGSFLLSAHDLRPAEPHDAQEPASVLGSYEVARLALAPGHWCAEAADRPGAKSLPAR